MATYVHDYNDSTDIVANPGNYDVSYMRGWSGPEGSPPSYVTNRFFLDNGMSENWSTFNTELTAVEGVGKPVIFRIIDWGHVPSGWPVIRNNLGETFTDLRKQRAKNLLEAELRSFYATFGSRLFGIDLNIPFGRVGEPSGSLFGMFEALGNGNSATGQQVWVDTYKWAIDLYTDIFGPLVIGNIGGSTAWDVPVFAHYRQSTIRGYRQDNFGNYDRGYGLQGENRATRYDYAYAQLGGRDKWDLTCTGLVDMLNMLKLPSP